MYDEIGVSPILHEYLSNLELELQRPIRIQNGGGRARSAERSRDWRRSGDYTYMMSAVPSDFRMNPENPDEFNWPNAITILSYATLGSSNGRDPIQTIPTSLYRDGRTRSARAGEIIRHDTSALVIPVEFDGVIFAQIADHLVSYLYPLTHLRAMEELNLDLLIGDQVRRCVAEGLAEELVNAAQNYSRNRFAQIARNNLNTRREQTIQQFTNSERTLAQLMQQQAAAYQQLRESKQLLDAMDAIQERPIEELFAEWDNMLAHPRIVDIRFTDENQLTYDTGEIIMTHPLTGAQRTLGEMRITLDLRYNQVRIRNLTNPRGGRQHPHVPEESDPCFGNLGPVVAQLMADREILGVIETLFQYLESFNPADSWGGFGAYWFAQPDEVHPEFNDQQAQNAEPQVA